MAISATLHTQKNLETHQNRLSRFFQQHSQPGQPAQAAPGGEHHTGLAGFPLADGAFVHVQSIGQLAVGQENKSPDQLDFFDCGLLPVFSTDQRISIKFFGLDKIAEIPFVIRIHNSSS